MSINLDLTDLEVFLAVKETGSFHAAATQLNLSQPAVTRRIKKLEEALDNVLFERTTRAVRPTLAAKRLQLRAEEILQNAKETVRAMRDESVAFEFQRGMVVTLATIPTVLSRLVIPAISQLKAQGLSPRLRILDASANEVAETVSDGDADFGICSIPLREPSTEFEPLFDDPMVLALPPGHAAQHRREISWQELTETPLILPARGTGNRLLIDEAIARARIKHDWTYEVNRTASALEMVRNGIGAALVPKSSVVSDDIATCRMTQPDIVRPIGLLSRIGHAETPVVAAFKTALRDIAASP